MHRLALIAYGQHAKLTRPVVRPAVEIALHDDTAADAGADGDADEMLIVLARALPALAQRRAIGIVFDCHGEIGQLCEQFAQVFAVKIVQRPGFGRFASMVIDMSWKTHANTGDLVLLAVLIHYRFPLLFEGAFIVRRIIFIGCQFFAVFINYAMFDVGSTHVKADK